jgi:hypothetical protein
MKSSLLGVAIWVSEGLDMVPVVTCKFDHMLIKHHAQEVLINA